tara:strand:- start:1461 stop:2036 length:576 start_codon:yes stop_codon:yes gene_type:complete
MPRKVIVLNGAPSSGKDTIAKLFRGRQNFYHMEVKAELFKIALQLSGISKEDWFDRYDDRENNLKEQPWDRLGGLSQREFLIKISEEWMKPVFGNHVFGKKAAESVQSNGRSTSEFIFSDGGFQDELDAMVEELGEDNILLIRLHREGCSFEGDSRGFLKHKHEHDVHNNETAQKAFQEIFFKYVDSIYTL